MLLCGQGQTHLRVTAERRGGGRGLHHHQFHATLHNVLDLQVASGVHEHQLLTGGHAEASRVAEGQNLLETCRRHRGRQLEHGLRGGRG